MPNSLDFPDCLYYFWSPATNMKRLFILFLSALSASFASAQSATAVPATSPPEVIVLKEIEYDFGKIPQGKPVYHSFEVTNKTAEPLKLDNVSASCGCTTPEWSKEAIPAGATSIIKVGYNAASEGPFEKFISVVYNGNQTKQIKIKGNVWRAPAGSAPANASVNFLKQQIQ